MYGVNIGGIGAPVSADYNAAASAIAQEGKNTAGAISFLGGLAAQTFTAVKDVDMEQKFRANKEAFMQTELTQQIVQGKQATQQAIDQRNKLAAVSEIPGFNTVPAVKGQDTVITQFTTATSKLEDALADKQISLSRYLGNVQTLTRQWIAQFPGRADEIRQQVGQLTGIKNADDFAYQTFLEQQMNMQQQSRAIAIEQAKAQEAAYMKDAERLVKYGQYSTIVEARRKISSGEAAGSLELVRRMEENDALQKNLKVQLENKGMQGDQKVALYGVKAYTEASRVVYDNKAQFEPIQQKLKTLKNPDGSYNLAKLTMAKEELAPAIAQLKGIVRNSFKANAEQLRYELQQIGSPNVDQEVNKVYAQGENFIKGLDSADGVLTATVIDTLLSSNRATIQDLNAQITSTAAIVQAFGATKFLTQYADPSQHKVLKESSPNIYNILNDSFGTITGASNQLQAMRGSSAVQKIVSMENTIATEGKLPATTDVTDARVADELVRITSESSIALLASGKSEDQAKDANYFAAFAETTLKNRGPALLEAASKGQTYVNAIANMDEGTKAAYLTKVNATIEDTLNPSGQLARGVGIVAETQKLVTQVTGDRDSKGNAPLIIKLTTDAYGTVMPLVEPNPNYTGAAGGVVKGKSSRAGGSVTPDIRAVSSVQATMAEQLKNINTWVSSAAAFSDTVRKDMATRFVEAYNAQDIPVYSDRSTISGKVDNTTGKSIVNHKWINEYAR